MKQRGYHWTDFREILYSSTYEKLKNFRQIFTKRKRQLRKTLQGLGEMREEEL